MILTDTGPLVDLLDDDDPNHATCLAAALRLPAGPLWTTWPCFTEAMYLLGEVGGHPYQAALWAMRTAGRLILLDLTPAEVDRTDTLMRRYRDIPMDLADASLVAIAENRALRRIFALDTDFYVYRLADGSTLEVIH
jgi:predicted nucleic acid-binding protein